MIKVLVLKFIKLKKRKNLLPRGFLRWYFFESYPLFFFQDWHSGSFSLYYHIAFRDAVKGARPNVSCEIINPLFSTPLEVYIPVMKIISNSLSVCELIWHLNNLQKNFIY